MWEINGVSQIKTDGTDVKPGSINAATETQHHLADRADLMSEVSGYPRPTLKQHLIMGHFCRSGALNHTNSTDPFLQQTQVSEGVESGTPRLSVRVHFLVFRTSVEVTRTVGTVPAAGLAHNTGSPRLCNKILNK